MEIVCWQTIEDREALYALPEKVAPKTYNRQSDGLFPFFRLAILKSLSYG